MKNQKYEVRNYDWPKASNLIEIFDKRSDAEDFCERMDEVAMRCYIVPVEEVDAEG